MDFTRFSHRQTNPYFLGRVVAQFAIQNLMVKMPAFAVRPEHWSGVLNYISSDAVFCDETLGKKITFRV